MAVFDIPYVHTSTNLLYKIKYYTSVTNSYAKGADLDAPIHTHTTTEHTQTHTHGHARTRAHTH